MVWECSGNLVANYGSEGRSMVGNYGSEGRSMVGKMGNVEREDFQMKDWREGKK